MIAALGFLSSALKWVGVNKRLLLWLILGAVVVFLWYKGVNAVEAHFERRLEERNTLVNERVQRNLAEASVSALQKRLEDMEDERQAEIKNRLKLAEDLARSQRRRAQLEQTLKQIRPNLDSQPQATSRVASDVINELFGESRKLNEEYLKGDQQ